MFSREVMFSLLLNTATILRRCLATGIFSVDNQNVCKCFEMRAQRQQPRAENGSYSQVCFEEAAGITLLRAISRNRRPQRPARVQNCNDFS